jgi:hypothetical protein
MAMGSVCPIGYYCELLSFVLLFALMKSRELKISLNQRQLLDVNLPLKITIITSNDTALIILPH